ncbi:hypothetical protein BO71DRAFT_435013 [Aspergillus ellipticus CBS 707.79]|uniref:Rhodopsin domain-containing protein n=1 Tax=Aspergillus ellipticus CBS 707.79 TaxID=1448320 RepID=A0A319CVV4_9EURO|nr:hypothetical protein BO71DRAFT_435013 [Aspergillus ellipticus CBS 707.79]
MVASQLKHEAAIQQGGNFTLIAAIFFIVLSATAMSLRLWARHIKGAPLGIDDWLLIAGVAIFFIFCGDILVGSRYASPPLYNLTITLIELSVLFLYRRIFAISSFRRSTTIVLICCFLWLIVTIAGNLLYCIPISHFWDKTIPGSCFNVFAFFLTMQIFGLLLDVIILLLPIQTILHSHRSLRKRLGLLGIFLLGAIVPAIGAFRVVYVYKTHDHFLPHFKASFCSVVSLGIAIICACLPTFLPLLDKVGGLSRNVFFILRYSCFRGYGTKLRIGVLWVYGRTLGRGSQMSVGAREDVPMNAAPGDEARIGGN